MTDIANLSNVAYKKGNWMRYTLWMFAAACIGLLIYYLVVVFNGETVVRVPEGYKFSLTDNYHEGDTRKTTYYAYESKIMVEDEYFTNEGVNKVIMTYDADTEALGFDADKVQRCEQENCKEKSEMLSAVKKMILWKIGREYKGS